MTEASAGTLRKIQSLLAYAGDDSTPYDAEKQSAMELAEKLMARYGVEQAHLAASGAIDDQIEQRKFILDNPYSLDRACLLQSVARPLRCKCVRFRGAGYAMVIGYRSDLDRVEMLYTNLLVQAFSQLVHLRPDDTAFGSGESTTAYRKSWLSGFSNAVRARLEDAENRAARESADGLSLTPGTDLVLRDRTADVDRYYAEAFPRVGKSTRRLTGSGHRAGHGAGQRADLGAAPIGSARRSIR